MECVQSYDLLDVEKISLFPCMNILNEIIEALVRLDLIESRWNSWKNLSGYEITRIKQTENIAK